MEENWVLQCYPRSGLGFKFRLQLNNTVGIIDSDYYNSDNEGHIFAKITNDTKEGKIVEIPGRNRFMQGIFMEYGLRLMMMWKKSVTADLAARRNNRKEKHSIFV